MQLLPLVLPRLPVSAGLAALAAHALGPLGARLLGASLTTAFVLPAEEKKDEKKEESEESDDDMGFGLFD